MSLQEEDSISVALFIGRLDEEFQKELRGLIAALRIKNSCLMYELTDRLYAVDYVDDEQSLSFGRGALPSEALRKAISAFFKERRAVSHYLVNFTYIRNEREKSEETAA